MPEDPKQAKDSKPASTDAAPADGAKAAPAATRSAGPAATKPSAAQPAATKPAATTPAAAKTAARSATADVDRRAFLTTLTVGWAAFAAAMGTCTAALGRFFFPNVLYEPPSQFKVGFPDEFTIDSVDERYKQQFGVWIVRNETGFFALSTICTHLGCTPNWLSAERKFKCPCHGSGFYVNGINFEGPAPRPLERYKIGRGADGQIVIDKSRKFQFEKGQWDDPDSFLST